MELVSKYHPDVYKGDKIYAERYTAVIKLRREDSFIRKEKQDEKRLSRKNDEQQMSMRYFKNTERRKPKRRNLLGRILTSKLFYCLLFVLGLELLIVLFIYS